MALPARRRREDRGRSSQPLRWLPSEPFAHFDDIHRRMQQMMRSMAEDPITLQQRWSPAVDIEETDDAYVVDVDLPSVRPEDVNIEMRGEELRVSGQVQQRERTGVVRRQNRPTGEFEYLVDLPSDIDPNRVDAMYRNGVLTVTVGKAQNAQPRRIEIRRDGQSNNPAM